MDEHDDDTRSFAPDDSKGSSSVNDQFEYDRMAELGGQDPSEQGAGGQGAGEQGPSGKDANDLDSSDSLERFTKDVTALPASHSDDDKTCVDPTHLFVRSLPIDFGDYRLIRKVGEGGMGIVYEAEQKSLGNRRLAVKMIKQLGELNDRAVIRFRTEVEAVAQLEHRHIVPVYHLGAESGIHYYAMKFIDGNNLRQLVKTLRSAVSRGKVSTAVPRDTKEATPVREDSTMSSGWSKGDTLASQSVMDKISRVGSTSHPHFVKNFVRMGIQIATALHHVHQQGVIHRDIKPANLLLDVDGDVWLTDFGLATIRDKPGLTAPGDLIGTYHYMSPEQAMGSKRVIVDHRTDIYSLGVTLYELLTLQRAYSGHSREEILRSVQFDFPPAVRKLDSRIPADLETIVMKAMAKDPNARFQSAEEMAIELQRYQDGKPLTIRPPTLLEKFTYWARAHQQTVASLAAVIAITFVAIIVIAIGLAQLQVKTQQALNTVQERNDEITRLLQQSEGLRLAANSALQVRNDPMLAMLLGIEAAKRHEGVDANDAIMRAIDENHEAMVLEGHRSPVGHVAFNRAGTKLVSTGTPETLVNDIALENNDDTNRNATVEPAIIWDVAGGTELGRLRNETTVTSAVFSPDDTLVLTASNANGSLMGDFAFGPREVAAPKLWGANTFRELVKFENAKLYRAHADAFSPDSQRIVLPTNDNNAAIFSCEGGLRFPLVGHEAPVIYAAFSPQGDRVVTACSNRSIRIWDATDGTELFKLQNDSSPIALPMLTELTWVAFSPDGRRLATGAMGPGMELWDLENGGARVPTEQVSDLFGRFFGMGDLIATPGLTTQRLAIRGANDLHQIASVPINKTVRKFVVSSDHRWAGILHNDFKTFEIWDLDRSQLVTATASGASNVNDVQFSPDSKWIATAFDDHSVRIWHVANGRDRASYSTSTSEGQQALAASPDGVFLSVAENQAVTTGVMCEFPQADKAFVANSEIFLPDSSGPRFLVANDERLAIHSTDDGQFLGLETATIGKWNKKAINSKGDRVAVFSSRTGVMLWYPDEGRRQVLASGLADIFRLKFDPSGERLFAIGGDSSLRIWNARDGSLIRVINDFNRLWDLRFRDDGKQIAMLSRDHVATVIDAETFEQIQQFEDNEFPFDKIRFSHDDQKLITVRTHSPGLVSVWDIGTGERQATLSINGTVEVDLHPRQAELLVTSPQTGAQFWKYQDSESVEITQDEVLAAAYSADGKAFYLATGSRLYDDDTIASLPTTVAVPKVTRWVRDPVEPQESIEFPTDQIYKIRTYSEGKVFVRTVQSNRIVNYRRDSKESVSVLPGHFAPVSACLYMADSAELITSSWDGHISFWNVADGTQLRRWDHQSPIVASALSNDGAMLVTGASDGSCRIWDLQSRAEEQPAVIAVAVSESPIRHVAFSPDASQVLALSVDNQAHLIDATSGTKVEQDFHTEAIEWAEFSPDGKKILVIPLASAAEDSEANPNPVLVVSTDSGDVSTLQYEGRIVTSHFDAESKRVVTLVLNGKQSIIWVRPIDSQGQDQRIDTGHENGQYAAFDPTGEFVYVNWMGGGGVWKLGQEVQPWLTVDDSRVHSRWRHLQVPFLPGDPRRIVTRRSDTFQFREWPLKQVDVAEQTRTRTMFENELDQFRIQEIEDAN